MAKFRIRLKLQGLELEVDGERGDIPAITAAVQQQIAGLVQPAEAMADGHKQIEAHKEVVDTETGKPHSKSRRRTSGSRSPSDGTSSQPIEFRHDSSKYGNPQQAWSVTEKCIWLLFVLEGIANTKEVSGPQLAATFNQQFKASGKIHPPHVSRDLGRAKVQNPSYIGEDKGLWFLTDEGKKFAKQLITSALSPA